MVSTHLKNISQIGSFPQVGAKIKNIWNHHLVYQQATKRNPFIVGIGGDWYGLCVFTGVCCNFLGTLHSTLHPPPPPKKKNTKIQVKSKRNWPCMLKQLAQGVVKPMLKRRQVESCPALKPAQGPRRTSKLGRNGRGCPKKGGLHPPRTIQKVTAPWKICGFLRWSLYSCWKWPLFFRGLVSFWGL